jgi:hypothetical protein
MRPVARTLFLLFAACVASCGPREPPDDSPAAQQQAPPSDPANVEAPGLHNVHRITDTRFSGSSPEGDEGFRSLQKLGVKTVLSVDGARPDVELAHK